MAQQKRYQIFISSTSEDLKGERQAVLESILSLRQIPVGMEHFTAASEEQFNYIKQLIDVTDYYVLIIGGRYGTPNDDGISYTELEYDYAVKIGVPVYAFIHKHPETLSYEKSEKTEKGRKKLDDFREKVKKNRLVSIFDWANPDALARVVVTALSNAFNDKPRPGWIRAEADISPMNKEETKAQNKEKRESVEAQLPLELYNNIQKTVGELNKHKAFNNSNEDNGSVVSKAKDLVNYIAMQTDLQKARKALDDLEALYNENRTNVEILAPYANGFLNYIAHQTDLQEARNALDDLETLYEGNKDNDEVVIAYAKGLYNFFNHQTSLQEAKKVIEELKALYEGNKGNADVAARYADVLFNIFCVQTDQKKARKSLDDLKALYEDNKDNAEVIADFSRGLYNFFNMQTDLHEARKALDNLRVFYEKNKGNADVAIQYGRGLYNFLTLQIDPQEEKKILDDLKVLYTENIDNDEMAAVFYVSLILMAPDKDGANKIMCGLEGLVRKNTELKDYYDLGERTYSALFGS